VNNSFRDGRDSMQSTNPLLSLKVFNTNNGPVGEISRMG
jgi:hypothetical protein